MNQVIRKPRRWWVGVIALVVIGAGLGFVAYDKLLARDILIYVDDEQNFKYGSIGNDGATGVPYAIWVVLPKVFPEYLPGAPRTATLHWAFAGSLAARKPTPRLEFRAPGSASSAC